MKLTPYFLLFSLAFLGLVGQKAYEYKLEQDDKKEVFCKNALFLLQAPDSLSNRVVDFDLPYDSLVNFMKKKILFDSCENYYFDFLTTVNLKYQNEKKLIKIPLTSKYISDCFPIGMVGTGCMDFRFEVNYINNNSFSMSYNGVDYPLDSLKKMIKKFGFIRLETEPPFIKISFRDSTNQEFIEKILISYLELKLENYSKESLKKYGKKLCELSQLEVIDLKKDLIKKLPIEVIFKEINPPPK